MIFALVFAIGSLAGNASKKERNGIILLFAMLLPIWLLGISIDVDGWLQRMGMDLASFLILVSAFTMSYLVMGLEKVAEWIENRFTKIKISKMKPKISFTVIVIGLLIVPLVIPNIAMGRTLQPILSPEEVHDLQEMQGKLPVDDCLLHGRHGLEYWVTHFARYECKKISVNNDHPEELFDLINVSSPTSYLITKIGDPNIPIVEEGIAPFVGDNIILGNPMNDSVQPNPTIISCITLPAHTTFLVRYIISNYQTKETYSENNLTPYLLPSGNTEWNFTLPTNLPLTTYQLIILAHYHIAPMQDGIEKITVIFHPTEPLFKTIYMGEIFAVVDANSGYVPSPIPIPKPPEEEGNEPVGVEESPSVNFLTFILLIRFPFLTNYLHYYFVIPLTLVYWSLLIFGTYRIVRLIGNKGKKSD